jgi:hypothetical protein
MAVLTATVVAAYAPGEALPYLTLTGESMSQFLDPGGMSQSAGIAAALRSYGKGFALEIVNCHKRFLAGDHEQLDSFGRSYYTTSGGTVVFTLPKSPPWFATVWLPQEL